MAVGNGSLPYPVCGLIAFSNPPVRCIRELGHDGPHYLSLLRENESPKPSDVAVAQTADAIGDGLVTLGVFAGLIILAVAFTALGYVLAGGGAC